jgi:hypothetical protein
MRDGLKLNESRDDPKEILNFSSVILSLIVTMHGGCALDHPESLSLFKL